MPLNPNIPLSGQFPKFDSPINVMQGLGNLEAQQFKQQELEKQAQAQQQIAEIFQQNVQPIDGVPTLDQPRTLGDLYGAGLVPQGLKFQNIIAEGRQKGLSPQKQALENLTLGSRILSGATEPGQAVQELQRAGIPINTMPGVGTPQWDKWAQNKIAMGIKAETLMDRPDLASQEAKRKLEARKLTLAERRFSLDEKKLDAELARLAAGKADPEKAVKIEEKLRGEFIQQNRSYQLVGNAYNRIIASAKDPSAAGDLALIFNYMKMLDPGSTVREGEFATAAAAGSVSDRVRGIYNRISAGKRLSAPQRKDFLDRSKRLMGSANTGYQRSASSYNRLANKYGVDPSRVTVDLSRQGGGGQQAQPQRQSFNSVQEAEAANLPPGTLITINGRNARIN